MIAGEREGGRETVSRSSDQTEIICLTQPCIFYLAERAECVRDGELYAISYSNIDEKLERKMCG